MNKITMSTLLIGLGLLVAAVSASAQCIEVTPESWDYGDVKMGTSEAQIFTIHNCSESDLDVFITEITDDATGAFAITSGAGPYHIRGGESEELEVTFTPPSLGAHEAFLHIYSNAPGNHTYISLSGVGVRRWSYFEGVAEP